MALSNELQSVDHVEDWDTIVGRRVHMVMWDRKISQSALGRAVGIDSSALSKRLRGRHGWSLRDLKLVAAALDVTTEWLLREGDDDPTPTLQRVSENGGTTGR